MKLGFHTHPRYNTVEEIRWIGENGFEFVDLFIEADAALPEKIPVDLVGGLLARYGLDLVGHTAWYLPIGSPSHALREAGAREAARSFELLASLGARLVTVHANWPPAKLFTEEEACAYQIESLKWLVEQAAGYGLAVMFEPVGSSRDNVTNISRILQAVPGLRLHIDIGHANLCDRNPSEFVSALHDRLSHVHLHDNNGQADQHLPVGCGSIDWPATIETLKKYYDGTITLEVFSPDRDYVLLARDKVRTMWERA